MKKIFSFCFSILFATIIQAQVYEFYPHYTYASDEFTEYKSLVPKKADTTYAWFKFDLDAKMITCQLAPDGELQNLPIKKIKIKDNVIDLALEPYKNIEKTVGYKLTLQNNQVLYCQHYVTYTGVTKTIGYQNYLTDLNYMEFHLESYSFIADTNTNGNIQRVKDLTDSESNKYTYTPNTIDMKNGKITLILGKGKNAVRYVYEINHVERETNGISISCFEINDVQSYLYNFIYTTATVYPYPNAVCYTKWTYFPADVNASKLTECWIFR